MPEIAPHQMADLLALQQARRVQQEQERMGGQSQTWSELIWANHADATAFNTSASEGSLMTGLNDAPIIPAGYFKGPYGIGRTLGILARGIIGTTSTPTIIFQVRLGTTAGAAFLSGTSVGVSAAITTQSGVSNKWWELRLDLTCYTAGIGTGNTTLSGSGYVSSPNGFASPFVYPLEPSTPDTATWTSTIDLALTYYVNVSVTWGTSSSSNTVTLKQLYLYGQN